MGGKKYDNGKVDLSILPFESLERVSRVMMFGEEKYGRDNWRHLEDPDKRLMKAMLRHISEIIKGNRYDNETGMEHIAHVACNALFLCSDYNNRSRDKE